MCEECSVQVIGVLWNHPSRCGFVSKFVNSPGNGADKQWELRTPKIVSILLDHCQLERLGINPESPKMVVRLDPTFSPNTVVWFISLLLFNILFSHMSMVCTTYLLGNHPVTVRNTSWMICMTGDNLIWQVLRLCQSFLITYECDYCVFSATLFWYKCLWKKPTNGFYHLSS